MISRRGFIGLVAGALGASAAPSLGWFDAAPPALAPTVPAMRLVYFIAHAGQKGGQIVLSREGEELISLAVQPFNSCAWFSSGGIELGPAADKLDVEIQGDIFWDAVMRDGRIYQWFGKEVKRL